MDLIGYDIATAQSWSTLGTASLKPRSKRRQLAAGGAVPCCGAMWCHLPDEG